MPNELEKLFAQPITPCPHCGTPNGADSETCLCCGKRMQEAPNPDTPPTAADGGAGSAQNAMIPAAPGGDAPDADEPAPLSPEQKRKRRIVIGLAVVCNMLLLAVVLTHVLYINSPGYRAAGLFRANRPGAAQHIYLQEVDGNDLHQKIMRREMKKYFDALDAQYHDGKLEFFDYTEKCGDILLQYIDEEINRYVKNRFHTELEDVYASYLRTVMGENGVEYTDALFAFSNVISNGLALGDRTEELFTRLKTVNQDEAYFSSAQNSEQTKNYANAIENYRKIRPDTPRAEAAAEGLDRCVTAYCTDLRERVHASDPSASKLHTFRAEAGRVLELWPENGDLQELRDWVQQLYINAQKQETLAYAADPQIDHLDAISVLWYALKELPGDAELQAAIDLRAAGLKAELPEILEKVINIPDLGWYEALNYVARVQELLPEDAEIAALYERMEQFMIHRLHLNDMCVGVEDLFQRYEEYSSAGGYYTYSTAPVADAFGVIHAPYSLYRFTATTTQAAVFWDRSRDCNDLRFKVFAGGGCTGSGVLELWGSSEWDSNIPLEKVWTSPVLDRTTNGLAVEVPVPEGGLMRIELRLVSRTGTVVMLLDDMYRE